MTAAGAPSLEPQADRARILVVMDNRNNAMLLARELSAANDVTLGVPGGSEELAEADLVILDGVSLHRYGRVIADARELQRPLLLPVLLLTDREETYFLRAPLDSVVDDIIRRPSTKAELGMRVRALLRSRALSLDVMRMRGLYETERAVAQRFQQAALPKAMPLMPGTVLSAYYHAGHRDVLIGGDWYDALELDDGRLVLSIGDVCGSGLDAAVLMAHVRQVIRGVAQIHPDPQMMLDAANRNLQAEYPDRMVTALAAVFDPIGSTLHYANAGHVPPMLRLADGTVAQLASGDLPLGVHRDAPELRAQLMPPGSALLMYTDGLTEFDRNTLANLERLERLLAAGALFTHENPAQELFTQMVDAEPPDDVAILVLQRSADTNVKHTWRFNTGDARAFAETREAIRANLETLGFMEDQQMIAEMIFAELIGNAVRYAAGTVEVVLDVRCGRPTIHVLDYGPSFSYAPRLPSNVLSETGRGLFLVKQLSREFNVSPRPEGGSHARAVLR